MSHLPKNKGHFHFIGIGGIGMSGIAELLTHQGYICTGSDTSSNANTKRLIRYGVKIYKTHKASNIDNSAVVIRSSAIKDDNIEVLSAIDKGISVISRAEMLVELMRLKPCISVGGSHGKSTTTSMIGWILDKVGYDPTVILGGIVNAYGTNCRMGKGKWMVVEADESDGSFLLLPHQIAVVTNIDLEHLDHYQSFGALQEAFLQFVKKIPFYGYAILCCDDPIVKSMIPQLHGKYIVKYGLNIDKGFSATNIIQNDEGSHFILDVSLPNQDKQTIKVKLSIHGEHNILNSLAAFAVVWSIGIDLESASRALAEFSSVERRFSVLGERNGVTIIDDYAHHPREIKEVIKTARCLSYKRIFVVFQPHRFTRLQQVYDDFVEELSKVDGIWISPVYAAGEQPIAGITSERLLENVMENGVKIGAYFNDSDKLEKIIWKHVNQGDVIIFMGAGTITHWAHDFVKPKSKTST